MPTVNEWDTRLDTGKSERSEKPRKLGSCGHCDFKGDARNILKHRQLTGHTIYYRGVKQL